MAPLNKTEQLIRIKNEFREANGEAPASARSMIDWAIETKRYNLDIKKAKQRAAQELADALRTEFTRDAHGNEIRVNLAFDDPEQGWLWDERGTISHPNMQLNATHDRRMIYGTIRAKVLTVNDYIERHPDEPPIQFSINFAADLADDGIPIPPVSTGLEQLIGQSPSAAQASASERERNRPSVRHADRAPRQPDSSSLVLREKPEPDAPRSGQ